MGRGSKLAQRAKEQQIEQRLRSPVKIDFLTSQINTLPTCKSPSNALRSSLIVSSSFQNSDSGQNLPVIDSNQAFENDALVQNRLTSYAGCNVPLFKDSPKDPVVVLNEETCDEIQIVKDLNENKRTREILTDEIDVKKRCKEARQPLRPRTVEERFSLAKQSILVDRSKQYVQGFELEWEKCKRKVISEIETTENAFVEQMADDSRREQVAKDAWIYQVERLEKQIEIYNRKLETVKDETEECKLQLEKYQGSIERLSQVGDIDELHQIMATLLSSASKLRKAKENRMIERLSEQANTLSCVVCQDAQKQILYSPCNHLAVCLHCHKKLQKTECPICREKIRSAVKVIFA